MGREEGRKERRKDRWIKKTKSLRIQKASLFFLYTGDAEIQVNSSSPVVVFFCSKECNGYLFISLNVSSFILPATAE